MTTSIYQHQLTLNNGETLDLSEHAGKVLLIVNTASKCGFTPQYKGLESVYNEFKDKGLMVIGCPCDQFGHQEPGDDKEIAQFCEMNFGVSFPLSEKLEVNGDNAHPLYKTLKNEAPGILGSKRIKWNFTKFLVNKNGKVIKRYAPTTKPEEITSDIKDALSA
uniref:glutathione peroxidase n=1 Tax=Ningiella ruwaisensis TaxID=2364274 RepID=UPI00109F572F|nr:glutathione peroxidase [Ningiella ruwaisensis]